MALKFLYREMYRKLKQDEAGEQKMIDIYSGVMAEKLGDYMTRAEEKGMREILLTLIKDSRRHQEEVKMLLEKYAKK